MGVSIQKQAKNLFVTSRKHKIVNFEAYKVEPNL
jgi:hypothetical protein